MVVVALLRAVREFTLNMSLNFALMIMTLKYVISISILTGSIMLPILTATSPVRQSVDVSRHGIAMAAVAREGK